MILFPGLSENLRSILKGLLHPDPTKRYTANQCLQLPCFVKMRRKRLLGKVVGTIVSSYIYVILIIFFYHFIWNKYI